MKEATVLPPVSYRLLTRAGPVLGAERAGSGVFDPPPPLTRLLGHINIETQGKQHSKVSKIMAKLFCSFFRSGQKPGHQRSSEVKCCPFNIFLQIDTKLENQKSYDAAEKRIRWLFRNGVLKFDLR